MNPFHLLWIVPLSASAGVLTAALCAAAARADRQADEWRRKRKEAARHGR